MRQLVLAVLVLLTIVLGTADAAATLDTSGDDSTISNRETSAKQRRLSPVTESPPKEKQHSRRRTLVEHRRSAQRSDSRFRHQPLGAGAASQREQPVDAAVKFYRQQEKIFHSCIATMADPEKCRNTSAPAFGPAPAKAAFKGQPAASKKPPGPAPAPITLTAQQVAYMAFVKIKLTALKPHVGPPPSINRWKMAAVGYPLWLWGDGLTDPPKVADSIGGLYVSLDPHVAKTVFRMGDGATVTCDGPGQPWTPSVEPGQSSPSCGHTYQEPSLPQGSYTITATTYWSVAWNANGETGVIPYVQSASATVPVGELQALVH